jgi:uncharacterized membrane protein SpoIIM required for sporulation
MQGFDVRAWVGEREPTWRDLEALLRDVDARGLPALGLDGARRLGRLYRAASSDLIWARGELVDAALVDYLNDLVARAYAVVHAGSGSRARKLGRFFLVEFPRTFREEWRAVALSALLFFGGGAVGAVAMAVDPGASGVLIPEDHQQRTPAERVAEDEDGVAHSGDEGAAFSSFLFTHNIRVTFLVFALGLTFGVGTVGVMFYNGVPLGALAMQYHQYGKGLFFWAWILPHGIPEITQILVAGAAGLLLARGLLVPGRRSRRDAVVHEAKRATRLVVGGMPILVLAGLVEGTISQMHEPVVPYAAKLVFAGVVGAAVWAYLLFAGRASGAERRRQALAEELRALVEDAPEPRARRAAGGPRGGDAQASARSRRMPRSTTAA